MAAAAAASAMSLPYGPASPAYGDFRPVSEEVLVAPACSTADGDAPVCLQQPRAHLSCPRQACNEWCVSPLTLIWVPLLRRGQCMRVRAGSCGAQKRCACAMRWVPMVDDTHALALSMCLSSGLSPTVCLGASNATGPCCMAVCSACRKTTPIHCLTSPHDTCRCRCCGRQGFWNRRTRTTCFRITTQAARRRSTRSWQRQSADRRIKTTCRRRPHSRQAAAVAQVGFAGA